MHLGQGKAIVGRAVPNLLAVESGEGNLDQLPAVKVVDDVDGEPLGCVAGGPGRTVVQDVEEQGFARVVAIQP